MKKLNYFTSLLILGIAALASTELTCLPKDSLEIKKSELVINEGFDILYTKILEYWFAFPLKGDEKSIINEYSLPKPRHFAPPRIIKFP